MSLLIWFTKYEPGLEKVLSEAKQMLKVSNRGTGHEAVRVSDVFRLKKNVCDVFMRHSTRCFLIHNGEPHDNQRQV